MRSIEKGRYIVAYIVRAAIISAGADHVIFPPLLSQQCSVPLQPRLERKFVRSLNRTEVGPLLSK